MPIINSYSVIGTGGGSGGTSNSEPYPFSIVTIISIPANEKFLLVPGKEHPREITLGFNSEPIDLYFGSDEISFQSIAVGERYRDTQLGIDLYVFSPVACEALVIIRSMEIINYIGEQSETPGSWLVISSDQLQVFIDSTKLSNPDEAVTFSAIIPDFQVIPNFSNYYSLEAKEETGIIQTFRIISSIYPTNPNDFLFTLDPISYYNAFYFEILSEFRPTIQLRILSYDEINKIFTLGV